MIGRQLDHQAERKQGQEFIVVIGRDVRQNKVEAKAKGNPDGHPDHEGVQDHQHDFSDKVLVFLQVNVTSIHELSEDYFVNDPYVNLGALLTASYIAYLLYTKIYAKSISRRRFLVAGAIYFRDIIDICLRGQIYPGRGISRIQC